MKPIRNFIIHWKKHGFKKTIKDLKYNFVMLSTPEQLLKTEIIGYYGTIGGTVLAIIWLLFLRMWYIIPILAFSLLIQTPNLLSKLQQKKMMADVNADYEEIKFIKKEEVWAGDKEGAVPLKQLEEKE